MKILHILDHSIPLHDGYAFRSRNIFRSQLKMGYHPVVLTSPKHEENWHGPCQYREEYDGIGYYRSGALKGHAVPVVSEMMLMRQLYQKIMDIARIERPDILHAHSPVLNVIPALFAGKNLHIPVVYEIRAFWEDAGVDQGTYTEGAFKYRLVRYLETLACRRAAHIAILCNGLKNELISRGIPAGKITPVYNGIDPNDFKPCEPDRQYFKEWHLAGKTVIGFIGSFYRYEGLDLLIKAFAQIAHENRNAVLLLVGGGEVVNELHQLKERYKLGEEVIMPGRIPHDRIPGIYALVDILVYPRHNVRLTELVTPLKPLEAMAMGKALIASDVGGHNELIRNNETGLLFPAGDENALVAKLKKLLSDEALRDRIREQGQAWVRKYHTWEATTSVYRKMYSEILN